MTHFTRPELEQLVAFYHSPLGQRLAEVMPEVTMESMRAGQQWGARLGTEVAEDLATRGIEMPRQ